MDRCFLYPWRQYMIRCPEPIEGVHGQVSWTHRCGQVLWTHGGRQYLVRCSGPVEAIHYQVPWTHGGNTWSGVCVLDPYGAIDGQVFYTHGDTTYVSLTHRGNTWSGVLDPRWQYIIRYHLPGMLDPWRQYIFKCPGPMKAIHGQVFLTHGSSTWTQGSNTCSGVLDQ